MNKPSPILTFTTYEGKTHLELFIQWYDNKLKYEKELKEKAVKEYIEWKIENELP